MSATEALHSYTSSSQSEPRRRVHSTASEVYLGSLNGATNNTGIEQGELPTDTSSQGHPAREPEPTAVPGSYLSQLLLSVAILLSVFLVALDTTIISTAIPIITDTFTSLSDVGWYAGVYALTSAIFQLLFGKFYTIFNVKYTFLLSIVIFEVGSIACATASLSSVFIFGRALAGVGSAGIFSGAFIVVAKTVPLKWRAAYNGLFGALYGVSSVIGPVLGGLLTEKLSWRWCFWINLPVGGMALIVVWTCFKPNLDAEHIEANQTPTQEIETKSKFKRTLGAINLPSSLILIGATIPLLLALQWGGAEYHWQNGRIIALLVVAGLSTTVFVYIQIRQKDEAFVPIRILKQRTVAACIFFNFTAGSSVVILIYYLPIWFQSARGASALESGFLNLPFVISLIAGSFLSGAALTFVGYFTPFLVVSSVLRAVGAGLLTTLTPESAKWEYILYQIIFGFGDGFGMQIPLIAVQTVLSERDIPMGISVLIFAQTLGSAIFIAAGQSIFNDQLLSHVDQQLGSGQSKVDGASIVKAGATAFRHMGLSQDVIDGIAVAYSQAITETFYVAVALSVLSIFGAAATEWRQVKVDGERGADRPRRSSVVTGDASIELHEMTASGAREDISVSSQRD